MWDNLIIQLFYLKADLLRKRTTWAGDQGQTRQQQQALQAFSMGFSQHPSILVSVWLAPRMSIGGMGAREKFLLRNTALNTISLKQQDHLQLVTWSCDSTEKRYRNLWFDLRYRSLIASSTSLALLLIHCCCSHSVILRCNSQLFWVKRSWRQDQWAGTCNWLENLLSLESKWVLRDTECWSQIHQVDKSTTPDGDPILPVTLLHKY